MLALFIDRHYTTVLRVVKVPEETIVIPRLIEPIALNWPHGIEFVTYLRRGTQQAVIYEEMYCFAPPRVRSPE